MINTSQESTRDSSSEDSKNFSSMTEETKELSSKVFQCINSYDIAGLKKFVNENPNIDLSQLYNMQGRTVLHSAAFKNEGNFLTFILTVTVSFLIL